MRWFVFCPLLACFLLFLAGGPDPVLGRTLFSFEQFNRANISSLTVVSGAKIDNGTLKITTHDPDNPSSGTASAAWFHVPVRGESFRTRFTMSFSNYTFDASLGNRDGMAFVIRGVTNGDNDVDPVVGPPAGGLGYGNNAIGGVGLRRSVAVEFDTYFDAALFDPTRNHYQVHTLGQPPNSANQSAAVSIYRSAPIFNGNGPHTVVIEYSDQTLRVLVDEGLDRVEATLDLEQLIGPLASGVIVGFTASTGGVGETQEILSWSYDYLGTTTAAKSVAYGAGKAASVAGETAHFTIQAVDQFGYNITEGGDIFLVSIDPATPTNDSSPVGANVTDNGDGTYSVAYRGTVATTYSVHVRFNGSEIEGSPWTMTLEPAAIDPAQCEASGALSGGTAGAELGLQVQARDAYGNKVSAGLVAGAHFVGRFSNGLEVNFTGPASEGLYSANYAIEQQGVYSLEILLVLPNNNSSSSSNGSDARPIHGSPWSNVTIVPADPDAAESYAEGTGLSVAVAGQPGNFTVVARDRFNNTITTGLPPNFAFAAQISGDASVPVTITQETGPNGSVIHVGNYTVTTAGTYSLAITLNAAPIAGAPFPLLVVSSNTTWGPECVAYGPGLAGGEVAQTGSFVIQARDPFGNNVTHSSAKFDVSFTREGLAGAASAQGEVTYNITQEADDMGKFLVTYSTVVAGRYSIRVSLDSQDIKGSPFEVTLAPGALYAPDCVARGAGLAGQTTNTPLHFTLVTFDVYGNALGHGGAQFAVSLTDRFNGYRGNGSVEDHQNGTYGVTYSVPRTGHYRLSVTTAGTHIRGSPWFFSIEDDSMPETEKNLIIAGSVIGAVLVVAFVVGLVILYVRWRRHRRYTTLA